MRIHLDFTILARLERTIEKKLTSQKHKSAILAVRHDGSELQAEVFSFTSALYCIYTSALVDLSFSYLEPNDSTDHG
jgi:hypothetical protein